ncbi:MAG: pilus assembly protein [Pirellulales bacterium]|nr:pilus assembly protein [Pirellulales bacterium]
MNRNSLIARNLRHSSRKSAGDESLRRQSPAATNSGARFPANTQPAGQLNPSRVNLKVENFCRSCRRNRRGAAVVEFAVVAPVFFLLVFGMIEYGRMVMVQQVITNASREGARVAVLDGATASDVQTKVGDYLTSAKISGATTTVSPSPPSNAGYGAPVTVTVSVPFNQVSWLPSPLFLGGKTMSATSVMRREAVQ